jgi:hypothetical protein
MEPFSIFDTGRNPSEAVAVNGHKYRTHVSLAAIANSANAGSVRITSQALSATATGADTVTRHP